MISKNVKFGLLGSKNNFQHNNFDNEWWSKNGIEEHKG